MWTTEIGISGSSTSVSASTAPRPPSVSGRPRSARPLASVAVIRGSPSGASRRRSSFIGPRPFQRVEHVVPGDLGAAPLLLLGVEGLRERAVDDVALGLVVEVGGDVEPDLLHERHDVAHPVLAQLVVGLALEAVLELDAVLLARVRQPEPLEREDEHPVQARLQLLLVIRVGGVLLHPRAAVAQVEGLLLVDLRERALPGPEGASDWWTSESSTNPAWSYSALASTSSYQESSGTSKA